MVTIVNFIIGNCEKRILFGFVNGVHIRPQISPKNHCIDTIYLTLLSKTFLYSILETHFITKTRYQVYYPNTDQVYDNSNKGFNTLNFRSIRFNTPKCADKTNENVFKLLGIVQVWKVRNLHRYANIRRTK